MLSRVHLSEIKAKTLTDVADKKKHQLQGRDMALSMLAYQARHLEKSERVILLNVKSPKDKKKKKKKKLGF